MASLDRVRADQSSVNLSTLCRYDPQIQSLVYTGKHCVLYDLSPSGQWVNRNVEGPFFVIERSSSSCRFRMMVLNRKDMDNFIADISPQCNLEDQNPYIFFRSTPSSTPLSIWFYDSDDALHAFKALQSCIDATKSGVKSINTNNTTNTTPSTKTNNNNSSGPNQSETIRNNAKAAAMKAGKAASDASISLHQVPPPSVSVPPALSTNDSAALQARLLNVLKDFDSADEQQIKKFHEEKTTKQKEKELKAKKNEDEKKPETKTAFKPIANQINDNNPSSAPSTTTTITPSSDGGQQLQSLLKSLKQHDVALLTPLPSVPMMAAADLERSIRIAAEKQKASTNNTTTPVPAPVSAPPPSTLPHHPQTIPPIIAYPPHNPPGAAYPPNPSAIPPMFYPNAPPSTTAPSSSLHSLIGSFAAIAIPSPATHNPPPPTRPTPPSTTSSSSTPYFPYLANLYASSSTTTTPPSSSSLLPPHYFQSASPSTSSTSNPYSIFDSAPSVSASAGKPSGSASHLSKEAFKASLITLLNDSRYLDQLYQRYLSGYPTM